MQTNAFRPYQRGDLPAVWRNLRSDDLREFSVFGEIDPVRLEGYIFENAQRMVTWDTDMGPVAVLGVTPSDEPHVGLVWAVASTLALPRWRFAVRNTPACLDRLGAGYLLLANFKDSRNQQQIEWLKRVGFTFINTHRDYEGTGADFHEFVRIVQ